MGIRCVRSAVTVLMLGTAIPIAGAARPAIAGPGEAARRGPTAGSTRVGVDYIVLVWYRDDDALGTFQDQTYDVRKGEYTAAVDDWLELMRAKHPRYVVRVLEVRLDRERGDTERLKVGSVIHRELLLAAARSGVILGAPMQIGPGPYATQRPSPRMNVRPGTPGAGGASGINLPSDSARSSPFPVPYPRPHP